MTIWRHISPKGRAEVLYHADTVDRSLFDRPRDVCVVGGGPAGVTLARALAVRGLDVALMEAGGLELSPETQDPYFGDVVGLDYYDPFVSRLRYLGGTSNHWGGFCRPLDAHDFEPQSFHPLSGWPIAKTDLDRYAAEADEILNLGPPLEDAPPDRPDDQLFQIFKRYSSPIVRFGEKYHDELVGTERIALVLHANLVDLRLDDGLGTVTEAVFKSYQPGDPGFSVRARYFCLCMGGLENPRFLLNARSQVPAGIGNQHDLVGRFFCDHLHHQVGEVLFENAVPRRALYSVTREFLDEHEVLSFHVGMFSNEASLFDEVSRRIICSTSFTERLAARVFRPRPIDCDRDMLGAAWAQWWEGDAGEPSGQVRINSAQALNPDSRVLLTQEKDDFGLNRLAVDWRLTELDYRTMRTAAETLGTYIAERNIGRVRISDWLLDDEPTPPTVSEDHVAGYHHMCTTRMSDDPRRGVVDRNCRVHGISNLYIGGSSVFATTGYANPTYTIVQLALRLAEHLADADRT
jgi:choline dehydrogenase-like flavoprotein